MAFVDSDFSETELPLPFAAGNHLSYNFLTGSPTDVQFVAGSTQDVELSGASAAGGAFLGHIASPTSVNQSVEALVLKGSTAGSIARGGVLARFTDSQNFVMAVVDLNLNKLLVRHRVAGTYNTVYFDTIPMITEGAAVKLEVIGRRARWWVNPSFFSVPDQPPDGAVDLYNVPDSPGEWGLMVESNSASADFAICHFTARELPSRALPPPDLVAGNGTGYSFTPITVVAGAIPDDALWIEWEVSPADTDDFIEAYRDQTLASVGSRVIWVRKGYTYDVRARVIASDGEFTDWTAPRRIVASGSKVSPDAPIYPDDDFPDIDPDWVLGRNQQAGGIGAILGATGRERTRREWIRPRNRWTLVFNNRLEEEARSLRLFFDRMQGRVLPFKWIHPTSGNQYAVRFDADELEEQVIDQGPDGPIINVSVPIIEVILGAVGTIDPVIELET